MIRRYLQRKRYFQKLARWYRSKKRNAQLKYNDFMDNVAQTSLFLALVLPHILYITIALLLKYFTPSLVRYLATSTILSDLISFYIPFVRTIIVVFKYKNICTLLEKEREESLDAAATSGASSKTDSDLIKDENKGSGMFSFFRSNTSSSSSRSSKARKSKVADAYKNAAAKSSSNIKSKTTSFKSKKMNSSSSSSTAKATASAILDTNELDDLTQEASQLLKYWTVYAILTALISLATLTPILGRIFYNANPTNAKKAAASISRWKRANSRVPWMDKIKLSTQFLDECKLFFFAWLRLLPTSLTSLNRQAREEKEAAGSNKKEKSTATGSNIGSGGGVKNRIKALEKQSKISASIQKSTSIRRKYQSGKPNEAPFSNQPLDIMFERLAPIAIAFVSTSTSIVNDAVHNSDAELTGLDSFKTKCITFCTTVLNAMVWTKLISAKTKTFIENTFNQCRSLLPAAITLLMPSYFTNYGVIFVRLVVPSANSSSAYNAYKSIKKELGGVESIFNSDGIVDEKWITISLTMIRFLQYWALQVIVCSILSSFAPVLAWIPLSTHMTWIVWAYLQLEAGTKKLYDILEWDLVAFGILKANPLLSQSKEDKAAGKKDPDLNETMTMQLFQSIMKKVPSSLKSGELTNDGENETSPEESNDNKISSDAESTKNSQAVSESKTTEKSNDKTGPEKTSNLAVKKTKDGKETEHKASKMENKANKCKDPKEEEEGTLTVSTTNLKGTKEKGTDSLGDNSESSHSRDENDYVCISSKDNVEKKTK